MGPLSLRGIAGLAFVPALVRVAIVGLGTVERAVACVSIGITAVGVGHSRSVSAVSRAVVVLAVGRVVVRIVPIVGSSLVMFAGAVGKVVGRRGAWLTVARAVRWKRRLWR